MRRQLISNSKLFKDEIDLGEKFVSSVVALNTSKKELEWVRNFHRMQTLTPYVKPLVFDPISLNWLHSAINHHMLDLARRYPFIFGVPSDEIFLDKLLNQPQYSINNKYVLHKKKKLEIKTVKLNQRLHEYPGSCLLLGDIKTETAYKVHSDKSDPRFTENMLYCGDWCINNQIYVELKSWSNFHTHSAADIIRLIIKYRKVNVIQILVDHETQSELDEKWFHLRAQILNLYKDTKEDPFLVELGLNKIKFIAGASELKENKFYETCGEYLKKFGNFDNITKQSSGLYFATVYFKERKKISVMCINYLKNFLSLFLIVSSLSIQISKKKRVKVIKRLLKKSLKDYFSNFNFYDFVMLVLEIINWFFQ